MSLCFLIPVKLDTPSQEAYLWRCLSSIRKVYPTTSIYILRAPGTHLQLRPDSNTYIVTNPGFSTVGALRLFEENRYADVACILHDSMVLLKPLPSPLPDVQFLYHFGSRVFEHSLNLAGYRRIVPSEADDICSTLQQGCFGTTLIVHHDTLVEIGIRDVYPKITTKYDFECMERILAFRVQKAGLLRPSLCGDILDPISDPWKHTEYASMTLDQLYGLSFPHPILKASVARK